MTAPGQDDPKRISQAETRRVTGIIADGWKSPRPDHGDFLAATVNAPLHLTQGPAEGRELGRDPVPRGRGRQKSHSVHWLCRTLRTSIGSYSRGVGIGHLPACRRPFRDQDAHIVRRRCVGVIMASAYRRRAHSWSRSILLSESNRRYQMAASVEILNVGGSSSAIFHSRSD